MTRSPSPGHDRGGRNGAEPRPSVGRSAAIRSIMNVLPVPVALLTTSVHGRWHGAIVQPTFCPTSRPPLMLVCLHRGTTIGTMIGQSHRFTLSFLGQQQGFLVERFSRPRPAGAASFAGLQTRTDVTGSPYLADAAAVARCRLLRTQSIGDHVLICGEVLASEVGQAEPLLYRAGSFWVTARL